jgi:tetratricopeptide (TPR) repeat protein
MHQAARCFGLALFAISSLTAQQIRGQAMPGIGYSGGSSTPSQGAQTTAGQPRETIFLSGRILMDDGPAPDTSIAIQRVCGGSPRTVAWTDAKGQFSFQWGRSPGLVAEASEVVSGGGLQNSDDTGTNGLRGGQTGGSMLGCELMADAPGFRSARLDLSSHRGSDNANLGTIVLHRRLGVEGTSVSATALYAPEDARKAWEKGVQFLHKSRPADAEKEFEKAVAIYPKYANAWLDLGRARLQRKTEGPARDAFLKAIDADGKLVEPYVELGRIAARGQNWPDAARYMDRALQLDPVDYPRLWFEDAVADYNVQNLNRAEKNAREALKVSPANRDPRANQLLGLILMKKEDYAGAAEALRAYVQLAPNAKDLDRVKAQIEQMNGHLTETRP